MEDAARGYANVREEAAGCVVRRAAGTGPAAALPWRVAWEVRQRQRNVLDRVLVPVNCMEACHICVVAQDSTPSV